MAEDLEAAVSRWAADHGLREEARARAAARRLADEALEDSDLAGVLRELAARRTPVRVRVGPGRSHRGVLDLVGEDYLALGTLQAWGLVALRAVSSVAPGPAGPVDPDDPAAAEGLAPGPDWASFPPQRLADAVERLAGQDLPVRVRCTGEEAALAGELGAAGADFLIIRGGPDRADPGGPRPGEGAVYVPLASVAELWVLFRSG